MKSQLLVIFLAAAAAASVISNEEPAVVEMPEVHEDLEEPLGFEVPEVREDPEEPLESEVDKVPGVDINEMSEMVVVTEWIKVTDEAEVPAQTAVASRKNLSTGTIGSADRLLARTTHYKAAISNTVHVQDITYSGSSSLKIAAIRVTRVGTSQNSTPSIRAGGIAYSYVTIRLQSALGRGYHYTIEIYGR